MAVFNMNRRLLLTTGGALSQARLLLEPGETPGGQWAFAFHSGQEHKEAVYVAKWIKNPTIQDPHKHQKDP